jgi:serine/threonine-protein kinase
VTGEQLRPQRAEGKTGVRSVDSQSSDEARGFLQQRLAMFGRLLAAIFGSFFAWRLFATFFGGDAQSAAYLPWQALSVLAFSSEWLICRGRARSLAFLRASEIAVLIVAGAGAISMAFHMSYVARPDTVLLLCMSYTLIVRAVMVPSSALRTLAFGATFALPYVVSAYLLHFWQHDPAIYTAAADERLRVDAALYARRFAIVDGMWWIASTVIATATSRVIYGLQKEVRDARKLGQYTLTEKLGEGGMGVVYLARHALLRRPNAIKLLPPERLGPDSAARFEREVQLTAGLTHPNTVRVYDYGRTPSGILYYAMEYLEGASLDEVVAQFGPMPAGRVIHVLAQIAGALNEAHGIGLIHRDIKPANIFLTQQGGVQDVAKVLDFGLVKELRNEAAVTVDERISGTPLYMAPEAIANPNRVDARSDLYSLGATAYHMLTGLDVFVGQSMLEICSHHLQSAPTPPSQRVSFAIPPDLERVIMSCLAKSQDARPASASALRRALLACAVPAWSEDDARRWYEQHGEALRTRSGRAAISGEATIAVDLAQAR